MAPKINKWFQNRRNKISRGGGGDEMTPNVTWGLKRGGFIKNGTLWVISLVKVFKNLCHITQEITTNVT
jgi:hypothetical protein